MRAALKIQDFDDPLFDPFATFDNGFGPHILDPYPRLAELYRQCPVHATEYKALFGLPPDMTTQDMSHYSVFGYELAQQVYSAPETFSNKIFERVVGPGFGRTIVTMDAPEHTRYRRIFQKAFLPNIISKWGNALVQPVIDELINQFITR